jgi:hypothetical protein
MCARWLFGEGKVEDRYCGNCGHKLKPDDRFCSGCGKPVRETARVSTSEAVEDEVPPIDQAQTPSQRGAGDRVIDVLIVLIGVPVWMLVVAFVYAFDTTGGGSASQMGTATAEALISHFPVVFAAAVVLTFLTVRWSRYRRRQSRHEAEVREAKEQFYLDEARKREPEDGRN